MPELLFWHILFLSGTGILSCYWFFHGRHKLFVSELCHRLNSKIIQKYGGTFGWNVLVYEMMVQEQKIYIEYRYRQIQPKANQKGLRWFLTGELEIRIPIVQKFWLRMLRQNIDEPGAEELVTDIPQIDKSYVIHADQVDIARDFLRRPTVLECILKIPIILDRLEIYKGFLKAMIYQPYHQRIHREEFEDIVFLLLQLLEIYEHQPDKSFQVLMAGGDRSCPYCRAPFQADLEVIVRCIQCGTPLHQQCWSENGQCTTWGCESTTAE